MSQLTQTTKAASDNRKVRTGRRPFGRRPAGRKYTGLIFVLPATALFAVFGVYTVTYGFLLSFARWNGFSPSWSWTGLQNYADILGANRLIAPTLSQAAWNTVAVMVLLPLGAVAIGFSLALLLNSVTRFRSFLRMVYFLPYVTAGIAVFYAWRFIYEPSGGLNAALTLIGADFLTQPQGFLGNVDSALMAVIFVLIWSNVPIAMVLYLTGLQTIPDGVMDAAKVDGAGRLRTTWSIILPLLNPVTALVVILMLREALQNFQLFLLMTNGGPVNSTKTLGLQTYLFAFDSGFDLGYASALGWILALAAVILAAMNLRILRARS